MAGATSLMERRRRRKERGHVQGADAPARPAANPPAAPAGRGTPPSDAALVRAAQRDPLAFAPLYQRYATPVYRYCFRQTADPEAAADLTAQIFTKALEALPRFHLRDEAETAENGSTVRSWLFAIAHNALVDARRRERPAQSLNATHPGNDISRRGDTADTLADPALGPEELAIHRDELGHLLAALGELPESQRQIVELRLAGLTTAEVAESLGLTRPAVKAAQTRAYRRLRDLLEPSPPPPPPAGPQPPDDPRRHQPPASPSVEEQSR